jgi:hypothetical protein
MYAAKKYVGVFLVTANVVPSSSIVVSLTMEVIRPSETSVLLRTSQPNIPEDGILHYDLCENVKYYTKYSFLRVNFNERFLKLIEKTTPNYFAVSMA